MEKMKRASLGVAVLFVLTAPVWADVYTFTPGDPDLGDLPHEGYYAWGMRWAPPTDEVITAVRLTYKNIYDWTRESDNLYTHLLDAVSEPSGRRASKYESVGTGSQAYQTITVAAVDGQVGGDAFANWQGAQVLLGVWNDPSGGRPRNFDLVYDVPGSALGMLADGAWGIGIDPDCHYFNSGVVLTIETKPAGSPAVPAPAAGVLAAIGCLGLLGRRLWTKRA